MDADNNLKQCLASKCKDARATYVNSGKAEKFTCAHIEQCSSAVRLMANFALSDKLINDYPCDQATKTALLQLKDISIGSAAFQVSSVSYCVNGLPSASNSVGYCHVRKSDARFSCASPDCGQYASKTKASRQKKICMHVHVLLCLFHSQVSKSSDPQPATTSSISSGGDSSMPSPLSIPSAPCTTATNSSNQTVPSLSLQGTPSVNTSHQLPTAATYSGINETQTQSGYSATPVNDTSVLAYSEGRLATMKLNMLYTLPYEIPQQIFDQIAELDSKAVISGFGVNGWPTTYTPILEKCSLCGSSLSNPRPHPGQKKGHSAMLLTNLVPFEPVTIQIKQCSNAVQCTRCSPLIWVRTV